MTSEIIIPQHSWQNDLTSYAPIIAKISSVIASQLQSSDIDCPLRANATLISKCIGTVPKEQYEHDWNSIARTLQLPRPVLTGIGACIGPNDVDSAVKEALRNMDMDEYEIHTSKFVVGIFGGSDLQSKTVKRIVNLVSKALTHDVYGKVMLYDEMQDVIAVLIMATS